MPWIIGGLRPCRHLNTFARKNTIVSDQSIAKSEQRIQGVYIHVRGSALPKVFYCLVGERFRDLRKITRYCTHFVKGNCRFKSNFVLEREILLRVALIGGSSHGCIYLEAVFARFLQTQLLQISAII